VNLLDQMIAYVAPESAARRAAARIAIGRAAAVERRIKRSADSFRYDDRDARVGMKSKRGPMTRAERESLWRLFRLNPFARKAMNAMLNALIGYGITGSPVRAKAVAKDWAEWIKVCDWDGVLDFYGIQELVARCWMLDGEVFIVFRIASGVTGNPLRLQVLAADQLATGVAATHIRQGIEFASGRPAAYHFKKAREGVDVLGVERIAAENVVHLFTREEPGQWRGRSHFESVTDALQGVDDYLEAEGVRKRIESCFVAFVSQSADAAADSTPLGRIDDEGEGDGLGPEGEREETFYPGMINYGLPGEQVTFGEPKAAGGFGDFLRWGSVRASAGAGVTYEGMTGDLSNVNFASFRAGENEFKRLIGRLQWLHLIPRVLDRVYDAFCRVGMETGRFAKKPVMKWATPPFASIDPKGDAEAAILEMEAGLETHRSKINERGYDYDEQIDDLARDFDARRVKGLALKGDPSPAPASAKKEPSDGQAAA